MLRALGIALAPGGGAASARHVYDDADAGLVAARLRALGYLE